MDGNPSKSNNVVVDFSMATALVREIYATLPYDDAKELISAVIAFVRGANNRETCDGLVTLIKQKLSGHTQLMQRFDIFLPRKFSLFPSETDDQTAQANGHADEGGSVPTLAGVQEPSGSDPMSWEAYRRNTTPADLRHANEALGRLMREVNDEKDLCVFLQCLNAYHTKAMSRSEFMEKIPQSIKECGFIESDIIQFLINCKHEETPQSASVQTSAARSQPSPDLVKGLEEKFLNLRIQIYEANVMVDVIKNIEKYAKGLVDLMWLKATLLFDLKDASKPVVDALHDLFSEFDKIRNLRPHQHILVMEELRILVSGDGPDTPTQDTVVDTNTLPRVSPSYVQTPFSISARRLASGETEIGKMVLSDQVMSISTGTEDCETQQRHNAFADTMAKVEDEQLTVSMNIDRLKSMLKHFAELSEAISEKTEEEAKRFVRTIGIGKNALHWAMLADLFDEDWEETKEAVHDHPKIGISVLKEALQKKLEEWEEVWKNECPKWKRINQSNLQPSLNLTSRAEDNNERLEFNSQSYVSEIDAVINDKDGEEHEKLYDITDLWTQIQQPHITLDTSNSEARYFCGWALKQGIYACRNQEHIQMGTQFWDTLSLFLHLMEEPPSVPVREKESKLMTSLLYCNEKFYCIFRFIHSLYTKSCLLLELLKKKGVSDESVKQLIKDALYNKIDRTKYIAVLKQQFGSDCYPLLTMAELIKTITTPVDKLVQSNVFSLLAKQVIKYEPSGSCDSDHIPIDQVLRRTNGDWSHLDESHYFLEAWNASQSDATFRVAYDSSKHSLCIRKVVKEGTKLPHLENSLVTSGASSPKIFLRRSLTIKHVSPNMTRKQWPAYVTSYQLKVSRITTKCIKYEVDSEDWMLSMNYTKGYDQRIIEQKTTNMLLWFARQSRNMS